MLRERVTVGLPMACVAVAAFAWPGTPGALLFFGISTAFLVMATTEFFRMADAMGHPGCPKLTLGFACALLVAIGVSYAFGRKGARCLHAIEVLLIATYLAALFLHVLRSPPSGRGLDAFAVSTAGFLYIFWCLAFLPKIYYNSGPGMGGRYLTLYLLFVAKMSDVGAFALGTLTARRRHGNRKLIPRLSPKKSWEGVFGGIVASLATSILLAALWGEKLLFFEKPVIGYFGALFFGFFCPIAGLGGDLAESYLKRASGMKDSGKIPGLGGALDLLDSLIPAAPVFYAFIHLRAMLP